MKVKVIWHLKEEIKHCPLTNEKLNSYTIKHTLAQFNTVRGFAARASPVLVRPVAYGG